jgi:hypothetical protein
MSMDIHGQPRTGCNSGRRLHTRQDPRRSLFVFSWRPSLLNHSGQGALHPDVRSIGSCRQTASAVAKSGDIPSTPHIGHLGSIHLNLWENRHMVVPQSQGADGQPSLCFVIPSVDGARRRRVDPPSSAAQHPWTQLPVWADGAALMSMSARRKKTDLPKFVGIFSR